MVRGSSRFHAGHVLLISHPHLLLSIICIYAFLSPLCVRFVSLTSPSFLATSRTYTRLPSKPNLIFGLPARGFPSDSSTATCLSPNRAITSCSCVNPDLSFTNVRSRVSSRARLWMHNKSPWLCFYLYT